MRIRNTYERYEFFQFWFSTILSGPRRHLLGKTIGDVNALINSEAWDNNPMLLYGSLSDPRPFQSWSVSIVKGVIAIP